MTKINTHPKLPSKEKPKISKEISNIPTSQDVKQKKLQELLKILNNPTTGCTFVPFPNSDQLFGIKPITTTTFKVRNPNGFNRLEEKKEEILNKSYMIDICTPKNNNILTENEKELSIKGITYIRNSDLNYIVNYIKNDV